MPRLYWCVPAVLLLAASAGSGGPVDGAKALAKVRVGAKSSMAFTEKFQGGRRACVIAIGDKDPSVDVTITVHDADDRPVAEATNRDYTAAIWYPARDASYKIVVRNHGIDFNIMYIVFR